MNMIKLIIILLLIPIIIMCVSIAYLHTVWYDEPKEEQQEEKTITTESCLVDKQNRFDQLVCMDNRIQELEERINELE